MFESSISLNITAISEAIIFIFVGCDLVLRNLVRLFDLESIKHFMCADSVKEFEELEMLCQEGFVFRNLSRYSKVTYAWTVSGVAMITVFAHASRTEIMPTCENGFIFRISK